MEAMLFYFYLANNGKLYLTPLKEKGQEEGQVLLPGLPLSYAQYVLQEVQTRKNGVSKLLSQRLFKPPLVGSEESKREELKREILKILRKTPELAKLNWQWQCGGQPLERGKDDCLSREEKQELALRQKPDCQGLREDFRQRIEGRLLTGADLKRLAGEWGLSFEEVIRCCQEVADQGEAEWLVAVKKEQGTWQCQRCGETQLEEWTSIYGAAATCPSCKALGALSSLNVIYRSLGTHSLKKQKEAVREKPAKTGIQESLSQKRQELPPQGSRELLFQGFQELFPQRDVELAPRWELSQAQKQAAQEVLAFVREDRAIPEGVLLWAACGAGKTEVCFPAIASALAQGKKVLFAAPRQDVVRDVAPRIQEDFQGLKSIVLTGSSPERFSQGPFVIATTHQILRFYQAFDLIFLDEMDAFPYHGNKALAWGLKQALKPGGRLVYLTATPSPESLTAVQEGRLKLIRLPARHHRKPLPVPEWRQVSQGFDPQHVGGKEKNQMTKDVFPLVAFLAQSGPVLMFVPKISWVIPWVELLQCHFPRWQIAGSYSSDPQRQEKIENLRQGKFRVFVSTSILERGVTIPNAQVLVLEADHEVFDERALVQMAGRVGRTKENPTGIVFYLSRNKTSSIKRAIAWIKEQNLLAKEQGLID